MKKILSLLLVLLGLSPLGMKAQVPSIVLTQYATGLSNPVGIEHCGDTRLFVVLQRGKIMIVRPGGVVQTTPFLDITSRVSQSGSERGLLGLAFHPDYAQNGYFFVNYTRASDGNTVVARYQVTANPDSADANSEQIMRIVYQPYSNHNCGRVVFGPDGYLYVGFGDGGSGGDPGNSAQYPDSILGKIIRIDVDHGLPYTIPADNPYAGGTSPLPEIWAMGVRNPWRFTFDRLTGDLWIADVGQNTWEEVDFQPAGFAGGANYGWRCYEGLVGYNTSGCQPQNTYVSPIHVYSHGSGSCSITGGYRYRGAQEGDLFGYYLLVDYCSGIMAAISGNIPSAPHVDTLGTFTQSYWSTFGEDADGELYLAAPSVSKIYKITTAACAPTAYINAPDTVTLCNGDSLQAISGTGLTYQWTLNGNPINGATNANYTPVANGDYAVIVTGPGGICNATSQTVNVTLGTVSVSVTGLAASYCAANAPVTLTGTPPGGTFYGNGMTGSSFDPAMAGNGVHQVRYTYVSPAGCTAQTVVQTLVGGGDPVSLSGGGIDSLNYYCKGDVVLPADTLFGSPQGGTFSGPGVTNNLFDWYSLTAPASYNLVYTYTDSVGCAVSDTQSVMIDVCTALSPSVEMNLKFWPNPAKDKINFSCRGMGAEIEVVLLDTRGAEILRKRMMNNQEVLSLALPVLPEGNYVLRASDGKSSGAALIGISR